MVLSRRYEYLAIPPVFAVIYLGGSQALDQMLLALAVVGIAIVGRFRKRRVIRLVVQPGPARQVGLWRL